MICHVVELGDEAPIIDGLAKVEITKTYRGTVTAQIWETRPHTLLLRTVPVSPDLIFDLEPGLTLNISFDPGLLRNDHATSKRHHCR